MSLSAEEMQALSKEEQEMVLVIGDAIVKAKSLDAKVCLEILVRKVGAFRRTLRDARDVIGGDCSLDREQREAASEMWVCIGELLGER
jgi:hypothetical protein